jgi:arylsulfatase A-like enzyme
VPCILRWPGKVTPGNIENDILSGLDWFPTFVAAAGNPNIVAELLTGKASGGKTYKVHLDGYNQRLHHPQGTVQPQGDLLLHRDHAVQISDYKYRFTDQPGGWLGNTIHLDWPILSNLRLDPFERYSPVTSMFYANWYVFEFWRLVFVQQEVAKFGESFVGFPPMQPAASFNLEAVKAQITKAIQARQGQ